MPRHPLSDIVDLATYPIDRLDGPEGSARLAEWRRTLQGVPDIAHGHHEMLDGKGYPQGLPADSIQVQTRMMTISDIYDALTASDRPYKKAVPHVKALDILRDEAKKGFVDADCLQVFVEADVPSKLPKHPD